VSIKFEVYTLTGFNFFVTLVDLAVKYETIIIKFIRVFGNI
jgi:hypothetical protein